MKIFKNIIVCALSFLLTACASKTHKYELDLEPFKKKERQNLSYLVSVNKADKVYPLKLGLLRVADRRSLKFHSGSDDYFDTSIEQAFMRSLTDELTLNKIFTEVIQIESSLPEMWSYLDLYKVAQEKNVDAIMITNLTAFHIFRDPIDQKDRNYFNLVHNAGFIGVIVYPKEQQVLWSGRIHDTGVIFSKDGSATPDEIGNLSRKSMQELMNRFKISLVETGAKWEH